MKSRFAVKSATLKFKGTAYEMASGPAMRSETRDAVEVTALSDQVKQFIPGALKEINEFTVTLYQAEENLTVDSGAGELSVEVVLSNGEEDITSTATYDVVVITAVSAPEIDASGDRKATYQVTFRPTGVETED